MKQWWEERRWLRRHAMAAPFGIFAATMLITWYVEQGQWQGPASWRVAGSLVDLGTVFYAMAAVVVERSIRFMFWALEQHQKWRARMREEGRAEGVAVGRAEGVAVGRAEGVAVGRAEGVAVGRAQAEAATARRYEDWLAKVAKERGIDLSELLPPDVDSPTREGC